MSLYEELLNLQKARLGPDHPDTLETMNDLAIGYQDAGRIDRALPLYEETLALREVRLGPDHQDTLTTMHNLGWGYQFTGQLDLAIPLLEKNLKLRKAKLGPDHPDTFHTMNTLATTYQDAGRFDLSQPLLEDTVAQEGYSRPRPPRHARQHGRPRHGLSNRGPPRPRMPILLEAVSLGKAKAGPNWRIYTIELGHLGTVQLESKMWPQAELTLRECLAIQESQQPNAWQIFGTRSMLGGALLGQKRFVEAEPLLRAGYEGLARRTDNIPCAAGSALATPSTG